MAKKILHLRGSKEDYLRYGVTVGEGELALETREGAPTRVKIGDGTTPYSELPYFGKTVRRIGECSEDCVCIELLHGYQIIAPLHTSYEFILPETVEEDYECELLLYTSIRAPAITYPDTIVFVGEHTEGGLLRAQASINYMITFKRFDDTVYATVKAAPLSLSYEAYREIEEKKLNSPASIVFRDNKNLLDISLGGYFDGGDTDGSILGLGSYNYDIERFEIIIESYNAHLIDFAKLKKIALQYKTSLSTLETADGVRFTPKESTLISLLTGLMLRPTKGVRYRIKARFRILNESNEPTVADERISPFAIRYSDQTLVKLPMKVQQDGSYLLDYLTEENKDFSYLYFCGMGDSSTTVEFLEEGFALYAELEGVEPPLKPESTVSSIHLDCALLAIDQVCDTLSLSSMTVTQRTFADFINTFNIYSTAGDYTVFYVNLSVPMAKGGEILLEDFTRISDPEMLEYTPYSFAVDEEEKKLLFTGGAEQYDLSTMSDYIFFELEGCCFVYERETPIIKKLDGDLSFRHYENYMVLRYGDQHRGSFILKQYSEKKGE